MCECVCVCSLLCLARWFDALNISGQLRAKEHSGGGASNHTYVLSVTGPLSSLARVLLTSSAVMPKVGRPLISMIISPSSNAAQLELRTDKHDGNDQQGEMMVKHVVIEVEIEVIEMKGGEVVHTRVNETAELCMSSS